MGFRYELAIWTPGIQIGHYEYVVTYQGNSLIGLAKALWMSRAAAGYAKRIMIR